MKNEILIGLTCGDPASIGPEILLKTLKNWKYKFTPVVIRNKENNLFVGKPSKHTGKYAYECLNEAVKLALTKKIKALVTGPVSKEAINLAGIRFYGQTDEIARICRISQSKVIMLFASCDFRIALFTRHIPLRSVTSKLKTKNLQEFLLLLNKELKKWFKIKTPKIAVLGLNPHASENGLFGNEEKNIVIPVIKKLNSKGLNISGPFSPDALLASAGQNYLKKKKQKYDVYVSFYHDQALPVFKAVCGLKGVNVTLGLPFLRVSVDHGTAFDIAGKNKASNEGLVSAIKFLEDILY